jgi:hypothetical protein
MLAATTLLASASFLPANATVFLSLSGLVGDDANWQPYYADPVRNGNGVPGYELFENNFPPFQASGGPGGLLNIHYSGPEVYEDFNELISVSNDWIAHCEDPSGCANGQGFAEFEIDAIGHTEHPEALGTDFTISIDTSYYGPRWNTTDFNLPAFAPYNTIISGSGGGNANYFLDLIVDAKAAGQPYSLVVSMVPEPSAWALMLAGFFGAGGMLRARRRELSAA